MHEPITELPYEVVEVRETEKNKLYLGVLALARNNLCNELYPAGKDLNAMRQMVELQREADVLGSQNWVEPAIEEVTEVLGGDEKKSRHIAAQFVTICIIEGQADQICDAVYKVHELEKRTRTPSEIKALEVERKGLADATAKMKCLVYAFGFPGNDEPRHPFERSREEAEGARNKKLVSFAVDSYVEELRKEIDGPQCATWAGRR